MFGQGFSQPLSQGVCCAPLALGLRVFRQDGTSIPHTAPRACGSRGRTLPRTCPTWCHKAFPLSACPFLWAIGAWESRLRWQGQPPLRCAQAGPRPHLFKRPIHPPLLFSVVPQASSGACRARGLRPRAGRLRRQARCESLPLPNPRAHPSAPACPGFPPPPSCDTPTPTPLRPAALGRRGPTSSGCAGGRSGCRRHGPIWIWPPRARRRHAPSRRCQRSYGNRRMWDGAAKVTSPVRNG